MTRRIIPQLIMLAALVVSIFSWGTAQALDATFCTSKGIGYRLHPNLNQKPTFYCFTQGGIYGPYYEGQIPNTPCAGQNLSMQDTGMTPDPSVECPQPPPPDPDPEPVGCTFSKEGPGYTSSEMSTACAGSNGVTVKVRTSGTGGILSQDLMASEAQGQFTIRILSEPNYLGRAQIRFQGETESQTYTPQKVLNDGQDHFIRVVILDGEVEVLVDGESQGARPYGQPLASAAMPVVIGGHCMYCTNNQANDVRDPITGEDTEIVAEYMQVDEVLNPSEPGELRWGEARWYNPETQRGGTEPLDDLAAIHIFDAGTDDFLHEHITYTAGTPESATFQSRAECIYLVALDLVGNASPPSMTSCDPDSPLSFEPVLEPLLIGAR